MLINNSDFNILIVDDDPEILQITERLLKKENFIVTTATSGRECLQIIRNNKPDLLLLDVMLPDVSGVEVCRIIKKDAELASIYVLLLSGLKIESEDIADGLETGADGYMIKPLKNRELLARVDAGIRIVKSERAMRKSEEKYRFMFENNPQPMLIYDIETLEILEVNLSAINHYGYSRSEFLSMTLKDIRPQEDLPALIKDIERARGGESSTGEWRHIKKNGEIIIVEITAHTIIHNDRVARHVLILDITERKQAEEDLKNSQELLRKFALHSQNEYEEEKVILATQIDDELTQTLVALKIDIGLLKNKVSTKSASSVSEELLTKLDQSYKLIENSIGTSLKLMNNLRYEVLYLMGFVEAVKLYSSEFQNQHNVKCNFVSAIHKLELDQKQSTSLFRIFQNAMSNIAIHSKATEVKIKLARVSDKLIFEIADNGIGFDQKNLLNTESNGLIIMKERTFLLDGKLYISSLPNRGTSIRVEIPFYD